MIVTKLIHLKVRAHFPKNQTMNNHYITSKTSLTKTIRPIRRGSKGRTNKTLKNDAGSIRINSAQDILK